VTRTEWIEAAVALGTVVLAGFTAWLAWTTRQLGRESLRARLDAAAPCVSVLVAPPRAPLWWPRRHSADNENWKPWPGDKEFVVPAEVGQVVLGRIEVLVVNDGPGVARVRFAGDAYWSEGQGHFADLIGLSTNAPPVTELADRSIALRAGDIALLVLTPTFTIGEVLAGDGAIERAEIAATAGDAAGVVDTWRIEIWGRPVHLVDGDAGRAKLSNVPATPSWPKDILRTLTSPRSRTYPA
jgi:hypothetical protein